ncbi:MAG TPA: tetratricopeptide repeat protein [Gallionella sp.]|nr:tetratricopeptide repeat protein [Gallionella sp.]
MNMFKCSHHYAALILCTWLSCASLVAYAEDIQAANRLFKQGQHSQALEKVNEFLANNPKDAQARFLKGLIFTEQGKTVEAIKVFSTLTEDYPELPEPYNNLAVLYAGQGQYDKAKLALEMAIRTHPSYATAHENLGDIYAKMASQAYDRALQLDRSNTVTKTKLAMIQDLFAGSARDKSAPARSTEAAVGAATNKPEPTKAEVVVPVVEKPASAVKVAEPVVLPEADNSNEVLKTVNAWAAAWSAKNVNKYLSFYAVDFKTPDGESHAAWESTRQERLSKPKFIQVDISKVNVKFSDSRHATVKFRQAYQASHLKTSGDKTLLMVKNGDNWLIQEERAN